MVLAAFPGTPRPCKITDGCSNITENIREIWRAKNPPLTEKQKDEFLDSRQEDRIRRSFHEMRRAGIRMVTAAEPDYPRRLRAIYDAPYGLFVKGELPNPNAPAVAIIGARRCTHHGGIIAEHTAAELTRAGILIISGLAIGIDSCSHQGALSAGGKTYAVMGCGPDICYPSSHRNLYEQIASHGGILSEYPPGREVRPAYFPLRNRDHQRPGRPCPCRGSERTQRFPDYRRSGVGAGTGSHGRSRPPG